ncbi:DNA-binding transcriptional regulator, GntR family [Desulfofustis glycolicus DSM 9705]|uniref:DNA-binding transcriptional regulator, GntR family n=2 Tax=Desulfofustis glycolicus TaxID=51195 RepID=A0A1M5Y7C2_9BACT|nr:DNA-binding transcriptional regulator, GntR family [Desulfofustis glycolicus DSM 9705]
MRQVAYDWLKKQIITLDFPMGSCLVENTLCRDLGMGRTPIREALQQLAAEGLVTILPRKGIFVSNINFTDFENLIEVRIMLETHVVRRLARNRMLVGGVDPDRLEQIRALFDNVAELVEAGDIDALLVIERKFHQGLVALLNNPLLDDLAEHIFDLVTRTWYLSFKNRTKQDLAETLQENLDVFEKVCQGDAQAAEDAIVEHVMNFRSKVFHQPNVHYYHHP